MRLAHKMIYRLATISFFLILMGCARTDFGSASSHRMTGTARLNSPLPASDTPPPIATYTATRLSPTGSPTPTPTTTDTALPEVDAVSLAFVGDIMLDRTLRWKIQSGEGSDIFRSVAAVLRQADISGGNLECSVGAGGTREEKGFTFLAPPAAAETLQDAGFDLLALANNHILDYGRGTLKDTLVALEDHDLAHTGAGMNETEARTPAFLDVRGVRIAFFAYADIPVEYDGFDARIWIAGPFTPGMNWADPSVIQSDLEGARSFSDFRVVQMHFGIEGSSQPSAQQMALAHAAIDFGADVVIGSHPHVLQPAESYKDRLILYSLGNFVFDGFSEAENSSAIAWILLKPDGRIGLQWLPVAIQDGIPILMTAP
jgi:poly-gamma-glutamate capsule biosynthesis protein CapA/YwtB (metallophosphatase superfamily)